MILNFDFLNTARAPVEIISVVCCCFVYYKVRPVRERKFKQFKIKIGRKMEGMMTFEIQLKVKFNLK
jgi:hypothetical protein